MQPLQEVVLSNVAARLHGGRDSGQGKEGGREREGMDSMGRGGKGRAGERERERDSEGRGGKGWGESERVREGRKRHVKFRKALEDYRREMWVVACRLTLTCLPLAFLNSSLLSDSVPMETKGLLTMSPQYPLRATFVSPWGRGKGVVYCMLVCVCVCACVCVCVLHVLSAV